MTVGWVPPTDDGGSPVTGYTATASPGGATCASAATSCTVAGLINGDPYTFTVTATNSAGTGAPGPPTGLTFAPGYESVSVSWVPPVDDGGSGVTSYEVTEQATGGTCTSGGTSCSVVGLSQGVDYLFAVTATNWAGTGPPSSVTPFTSACIPASYTDVADCDLQGIDLSGDSAIYDDFTGDDFTGADLAGANLSFATLTGTDLAGADLTGTNLNGIVSGGITGTPAALPSGWAIDNGYLVGPGSTINGTYLGETDLTTTDLNFDSLTNDSFAGSDLAGVLLDYATLTGDDFTGADLTGDDFTGADLTGANFAADLTGAIFNNTTCSDGTNSNNDEGTCIGH